MNLKKLGILAVILVLLGAYFFFYEIRTEREKQKAKEQAKKIVVFKPEDVEELQLKTEDETLLLQREKDFWMIKAPVAAKADTASIESALATLAKAETERTVNENPENLKDYGLDKPSMEIIIKEKDRPPLDVILLGNKNPTEYYVYMKKADYQAIMLTSSGLKDQLDKDVYFYRDKTLLDIHAEEVKKLFIQYKDVKADLEQDSGGDWHIKKPIQAKADGGTVRRLIYSLKNSKVNGFVHESPDDLKTYGLDHPEMEVAFFGENNRPLKSVQIGARATVNGDFYAKWRDAETVFLIPGDFFKDYPRTLFDLRDKTVLDFEKEKIVQIDLKYPDEKISIISSAENQWNITEPVRVKADEFEVSDLLWAMLDIQAEGFIMGGSENMETYGFKRPQMEVSLWEKDQEKPDQLFITTKEDGKTLCYAMTNHGKAIYRISSDVLKDLEKTPFDLRDKTLLSFNNQDVGMIQVKYPDKTLVLKLKKGDWKAIEPEKAKLYKPEVISFLWDIKLLKFKEILSEGDKESTSVYGFQEPRVEITLWKGEESKIGSILIGRDVPGRDLLYAKVDSIATAYGVDPEFLEKLPHDVEDLK